MPFTEKVKLEAKSRSAFRCCICHKPFVEVHHIIPEAEGGSDEVDNAAPLCSSCHDLYGANPEKRKIIRQMRDYWWELMSKRKVELAQAKDLTDAAEIEAVANHEGLLKNGEVILYHVVFEDEEFDTAAHHLFGLVRQVQNEFPNQPRALYLDIDGHKNAQGGFDHDMFELQVHFLAGFLSSYLSRIVMPLAELTNQGLQKNDFPEQFVVTDEVTSEKVNEVIDEYGDFKVWIADRKKWPGAE